MVSSLARLLSGQGFLILTMTIAEQYDEERGKLELNRLLDWSTFAKEYKVAGEVLVPMTVQVWFDMLAIKQPIIYSNEPGVDAIVDYIWRNSKRRTDNKLLKEWRIFWLQRRVIKTLKNRAEAPALIQVLSEHLKSSLDEFPSDSSNSTSRRSNSMPVVSGEASMVDELAHRYCMHPEDVLSMPLRRAFSLQRTIRLSTIPGYKLLEPESLREIKSKYLNSLNNGN